MNNLIFVLIFSLFIKTHLIAKETSLIYFYENKPIAIIYNDESNVYYYPQNVFTSNMDAALALKNIKIETIKWKLPEGGGNPGESLCKYLKYTKIVPLQKDPNNNSVLIMCQFKDGSQISSGALWRCRSENDGPCIRH